MGYAGILVVPLVLVGCLAAVVALMFLRARVAMSIVLGVCAYFVWPVYWYMFAYTRRPEALTLRSWTDHVMFAEAVLNRADFARAYLPWTLPPLAIVLFAGALIWRASREKWVPPVALAAALPSCALTWWALVSPASVLPPSDPRTSWGYYREWKANGADTSRSAGCTQLLIAEGGIESFRAVVSSAELQEARHDCRAVCQLQVQRRRFNPGMLETYCPALLRH